MQGVEDRSEHDILNAFIMKSVYAQVIVNRSSNNLMMTTNSFLKLLKIPTYTLSFLINLLDS